MDPRSNYVIEKKCDGEFASTQQEDVALMAI